MEKKRGLRRPAESHVSVRPTPKSRLPRFPKSNKRLHLLPLSSVFCVRKLHSVHPFWTTHFSSPWFPEESEIRLRLQGYPGETAFITGLWAKPGLQKGKPSWTDTTTGYVWGKVRWGLGVWTVLILFMKTESRDYLSGWTYATTSFTFYFFVVERECIEVFCLFLVAACKLLVAACMRNLVPRPGIEPAPLALGAWSLTHWTTREVPMYRSFKAGLFDKFVNSI